MSRSRICLIGVVLLSLVAVSCAEGVWDEEGGSTADSSDTTSPVELRYLGSWDVEEVWLLVGRGDPIVDVERRLLTDDLIPADADLPSPVGVAIPRRDVSLYLELERTSDEPGSTAPRWYSLEIALEEHSLGGHEPTYFVSGFLGTEFDVGVHHLGADWELLKETIVVFGSWNPSWRFEQIYRGPAGELYWYQPIPSFGWTGEPELLRDKIDDGFGLYDFVDFQRNPATLECPIDEADLAPYDVNPEIPDIVERWAPIIYQDIDMDNPGADFMTTATFDGNLLGRDNAENWSSYPVAAWVHYSLVRGTRHDFIGYFFYHAEDTRFDHEHDFEGLIVAYNRCTNLIDMLLTRQGDGYASYVPPHNPPWSPDSKSFGVGLRHAEADVDGFYRPEWMYAVQERSRTQSGVQHTYETLAIGAEANSHTVRGCWNSVCVIGPTGQFDAYCDDSHGGDGLIYAYEGYADMPAPPFRQYPNWTTYSYDLVDIGNLWKLAHDPDTCGQDGDSHLFACEGKPPPYDTFNSAGDDTVALPWVWAPRGFVADACDNSEPNLLLDPAATFVEYFEYAFGNFVHGYISNPYTDTSTCE